MEVKKAVQNLKDAIKVFGPKEYSFTLIECSLLEGYSISSQSIEEIEEDEE